MKKTHKNELTIKERKFVIGKIKGKGNMQSYVEAGYKMRGKPAAVDASKVKARPHVKKAIDDALEIIGATPEFAVRQLMKVAEQDKELGAKRLASKDLLELHGWNKAEKPTMTLDIKNAFFGEARRDQTRHIEAEDIN